MMLLGTKINKEESAEKFIRSKNIVALVILFSGLEFVIPAYHKSFSFDAALKSVDS